MIQRIVLLTLNTGIWTALFTILTLAMVRAPRSPSLANPH
jgi:hypothetical protein